MWDVYGVPFTTSSFNNGTLSVRARMNNEIILKYARTGLILYNDATFTNVTMKIYYDNNGSIGSLYKASTTTWNKADIFTLKNGYMSIYFDFGDIVLDANNWYHFVIVGSGASFSDSAHLAWKHSYPFPTYTTGWTQSFRSLPSFPYELTLVGEEF